MNVSLVINTDTRKGFDAPTTKIGEFGEGSLQGCRSLDYLTHGISNKRKFFEGHDLETIVVVDEHEPLPGALWSELRDMRAKGEITTLHVTRFNHTRPKWNDHLYLESIALATGEFICHMDQDTACFSASDYDWATVAAQHLKTCKYVCQPSEIYAHGMYWASSRFFFSRRETLDICELTRCLDDAYRRTKYGDKHCPCLEAVLGVVAGENTVLYPKPDPENYLIFSWVVYFQGLLQHLNTVSYPEVAAYIKRCGMHGANDVIAQPL